MCAFLMDKNLFLPVGYSFRAIDNNAETIATIECDCGVIASAGDSQSASNRAFSYTLCGADGNHRSREFNITVR